MKNKAPARLRKKHYFGRGAMFVLCAIFAVLFLLPTVLTITNSFMSEAEIKSNYGMIFATTSGGYVSKTVNLKFIPDKVTLSQYITGLIKSPEYLLKLWNSILLVVPIVILQVGVAAVAAYSFTRWRGKIRSGIFFFYVILMLMPYQVTLVPNYLVSQWLGILNTPLGYHPARHVRAVLGLPADKVHAPHPVFAYRGGEGRRSGGVGDIHQDLPAPVPFGALFYRDPCLYRLLEHGRAAPYPAPGFRGAAALGVPFQH